LAVVNGDDENVLAQTGRSSARIIRFGLSESCHFKAERIDYGPAGTTYMVNGQPFKINHLGLHNVYNSLAAIAAGEALGVDLKTAAERLAGLSPTPMRLEMINTGRFIVINDAYNANPPSMRAALKVLESFDRASRKVAILGDMLELGDLEKKWHREIGSFAAGKADLVITVGPLGKEIHTGAVGLNSNNLHYHDNASLIKELGSILRENDVILVKASRGRHFEEIVNAIKGLS